MPRDVETTTERNFDRMEFEKTILMQLRGFVRELMTETDETSSENAGLVFRQVRDIPAHRRSVVGEPKWLESQLRRLGWLEEAEALFRKVVLHDFPHIPREGVNKLSNRRSTLTLEGGGHSRKLISTSMQEEESKAFDPGHALLSLWGHSPALREQESKHRLRNITCSLQGVSGEGIDHQLDTLVCIRISKHACNGGR